MGSADGNGWVQCRCGRRHWGLHGAAGLLLLRDTGSGPGAREVLLQLRAPWVHQGGTWAAPGGALDSHESPVQGALRESEEEAGIRPSQVRVIDVVVSTDHPDWRYHLVLGAAVGAVTPHVANPESQSVQWFPLDRVAELDLHPGFGASWPTVAATVRALDGA